MRAALYEWWRLRYMQALVATTGVTECPCSHRYSISRSSSPVSSYLAIFNSCLQEQTVGAFSYVHTPSLCSFKLTKPKRTWCHGGAEISISDNTCTNGRMRAMRCYRLLRIAQRCCSYEINAANNVTKTWIITHRDFPMPLQRLETTEFDVSATKCRFVCV